MKKDRPYYKLECKITALGTEYKGLKNVTVTGIQCKKWTSNWPTESLFKEYVGDQENYCRNPDFTSGGPWCYTMDPTIRWQYCDVQYCVFSTPTTLTNAESTEKMSTTDITLSTDRQTTTDKSSTTELQTTTDKTSTTDITSTTELQPTTDKTSTTELLTTTDKTSTTELQSTSDKTSTTELQTTSDKTSTTELQTTTEKTSPTEYQTTNEMISITEQKTTVAVKPHQCFCPCGNKKLSDEELYAVMKELEKKLTVDKKTTSAYIRRHTSARDDRKSSVTIGTVGIVVVCIPVVLMTLSDCIGFFSRK
ncbi:PLG [Mytilus edulis]|uniref:PLG n=1 Tax=Mytilus edulis TaxID=6550 RepID=A0A8S3TBU7_MYTED|nr:PLG [Mytilus edulis]